MSIGHQTMTRGAAGARPGSPAHASRLAPAQRIIVASMLFGLFFGAGNLIFPLHLGQLAGAHWWPAAGGFLVTAVALPLLSILAISVTRSNGIHDVALPLGSGCALVFMVLVHMTIGPMFATPRTATVSFTVGVQPLLGSADARVPLILFSLLFFGATYWCCAKQRRIVTSVGAFLNPLFLLLLFVVFLMAYLSPMGDAAAQPAAPGYETGAFASGFLQGYNTMDALAGLAFGVTVVTAIRGYGVHRPASVAREAAFSGTLAVGLIGVIYVLLIGVGAMSATLYAPSSNGGIAFNQIIEHYMGRPGHALLAALMTFACLKSAIGLAGAFAQDFHRYFPVLGYRQWLAVTVGLSFLTANMNLDTIIAWSTPALMFLYPVAICLILLALAQRWFRCDPVVYITTLACAAVPAVFDMIASLPAPLASTGFVQGASALERSIFPLAGLGMAWILPAATGLVVGLILHGLRVTTPGLAALQATLLARVEGERPARSGGMRAGAGVPLSDS